MTSPTKPKITVLHCWSAPRSRSTAFLYSFEARDDCVAIDEPLYREWLIMKGDTVSRPYTNELIQGVPPADEEGQDDFKWKRELDSLSDRVWKAATKLATGDEGTIKDGVVFCKHMAKHCSLYNFQSECAPNDSKESSFDLVHKHILLIRDPVDVLSSWDSSGNVHGSSPAPDEVGIVPLLQVYSSIQSHPGKDGSGDAMVVALDSDELAVDPKSTLQALCQDLNIPYQDSMLTWKSGPHDCDGPWAKWWYHRVHQSSGWERDGSSSSSSSSDEKKSYKSLNPALMPTLRVSFSAYEYLITLTRKYRQRGPPPETIYEDPRNENLLVYVGAKGGHGRVIPREMAGVSPFDSAVQGGDGAWEGLRVYRGKILSLEKHLRRLFKSAKALGYENVHTKEEVIDAIFRVLAANGMRDGAHMRLTLTRGEKCSSSMNPKFNVYGTTLIILPEWKPTEGATTYDNTKGITLISASQRRNSPSTVDSKIHHNNMINNILPKIQANLAGAADAIMLDLDGFVSETNATNIFMVDDGVLLTPHGDHCLPGITRQTVLQLAQELNIPSEVRRISLAEFHSADEVFTTGTMGELTPVTNIDGRVIGTGFRGEVTSRLQEAYKTLPERPGWATEIPPYDS